MDRQTFSVQESLLDLCIFKNLIATICISVYIYLNIFVFRLRASFRGNTVADLFTMKEQLQYFYVLHFGTLFWCFYESSIFCEQIPHSAKVLEIFPLVLRFCLSVGSMP